jgi:succinoglycan biosynthesis transport protein ExoP
METERQEQEPSSPTWLFNHIPAILWQRRYLIVLPFLIATVIGVVAAFALPTTYRSSATLLVESQDLPEDLVASPTTGAIDQRIARIREQVLSRGDLIQLIEQYGLYQRERGSKPLSDIVEKMRHSTGVGALAGDIGQSSNDKTNTVAIEMTFDYPDATQAQEVLQSFVAKFLKMDSEDVEQQANVSVRFLQDQADKLQTHIGAIESELTSLKARNGAALATSGGTQFLDTGSFSAQITGLQNENRQLVVQSQNSGGNSELTQAEAALAAAEALYSDSHPDVVRARERVRQLRELARTTPDTGNSMIQQQIAANNAAIQTLMQQRDAAVARANSAMAGQARAPAILEQAMQLENRASTLRSQYQQVSENLLKAQNSARMASEQRAERLSLVEPASLPDKPFSPNRPLLIAGAAAAGLLLGFVLALLVELVLKPIRSPSQLDDLGLPVIGLIPVLRARKARTWMGRWWERRIAS